jgi:hypothetical protein
MEAALNQQREISGTAALRYLRDGLVTMGVLLLVFAAFDDITTDNATTFRLEYTFLLASAGWLFFLALRLLRHHDRVIGAVSLLALAAAVWAQRAIGPGITPGFWSEYVVATAAYVWFSALSFVLLFRGWRGYSARPRQSA